MNLRNLGRVLGLSAILAGGAASAQLPAVDQVNLVTDDQAAHPAALTDTNLVNAWGISLSASSPFWVSNNGTGTSTLYAVDPITNAVTKRSLTVSIPGDGSVTGQVFNTATASGAFNKNNFLFVSEDGTVSGWRGALGSAAETLVAGSSANVYKGSAFAVVDNHAYLYGANFRAGSIDVIKGDTAAPTLTGIFSDPNLPSGYAPFNIQKLGNKLYVAYAEQDGTKHDEVAGAGKGFVDSFDLNGNFVARVASSGTLNAPWALALAPTSFGQYSGDLLVGNFGDGTINVFDPNSNTYIGQLHNRDGSVLAIDGLWGLTPGNGVSGGSTNALYFAAGPDGESHGLFGSITVVPEPSTFAFLAVFSLPTLGALLRARRKARSAA